MNKLMIALVCSIVVLTGCDAWRMTQKEKDQARKDAGDAVAAFGFPRILGEAGAGLALLFAGHKHGRRKERVCQTKKAA